MLIFCIILQKQKMECNRLLAYKQTKRNWDIHEEKIKGIKPMVNTRQSQSASRVKLGKKVELNRMLDVQFQNKALLNKLTKCKTRCDLLRTTRAPKISRGKNIQQEHERSYKNRGLVERIKNSKPTYKVKGYLKQFKEKEKYANMICKYAYKNKKPTKTIVHMEMVNDASKYFDVSGKKGVSGEGGTMINQEGKKMEKMNKIIRIHSEKNIKVGDLECVVKGVEMEECVVIEVSCEEDVFMVEVGREPFETKYGGIIQNLMKFLRYDKKDQEFYLL